MISRGLIMGMMFISTGVLLGQTSQPGKQAGQTYIPVVAWYGVDPGQSTVERYKELGEAGFTHNLTFFPSADSLAKGLDAAGKAGVKMLVNCPELAKDTQATVRRFMDHPAVAAWCLQDEPSAKDFPRLAKLAADIEAIDKNPEHFCYVNLFPNYASTGAAGQLGTATYEEHVNRFLKEVPVKVLSFDHYPIVSGSVRPQWHENLEIIARSARQAGKPLWAFALSVDHYSYSSPTLAHLRLQVFTNLAYGAQAIQYFTYWTPAESGFRTGPMTRDGKQTPIYNLVRQVNQEIRGLSPVFLGSRVISIGHTGKLPAGTTAYGDLKRGVPRLGTPAPAMPITAVKADGGAVVSLLAKDNDRFLAIVNRSFTQRLPLEVAWRPGTAISEFRKDGATVALPTDGGDSLKESLEPGDVKVLTWSQTAAN